MRMPVAPGRNIALLVEVAARNQLLKRARLRRRPAFRARVDEMVERRRSAAAAQSGARGGGGARERAPHEAGPRCW